MINHVDQAGSSLARSRQAVGTSEHSAQKLYVQWGPQGHEKIDTEYKKSNMFANVHWFSRPLLFPDVWDVVCIFFVLFTAVPIFLPGL